MPVFGLKMPDLRVNEQTGEVGHNLQKPASRDDSDAFDLSVVIADEPEVRVNAPKVRQPGNDCASIISPVI
jgi:hypothetical protein